MISMQTFNTINDSIQKVLKSELHWWLDCRSKVHQSGSQLAEIFQMERGSPCSGNHSMEDIVYKLTEKQNGTAISKVEKNKRNIYYHFDVFASPGPE